MSHIFISYARKDKVQLDRLLTWLAVNKFEEHEIWYDRHIDGGTTWHDELVTALDHAFLVLVLVTKDSMDSKYCTFEWAYAMGQSIPVLPLYFDEISNTAMLPSLAATQYVDCRQLIPETLSTMVRQYRTISPRINAINRAIYEAVYDTHRRYYILGWIGDNLRNLGDPDLQYQVAEYFAKHANEAHSRLESLITNNASAFTSKQYRFCWQLIDGLRDMTRNLPLYFEDALINPHLFDTFDSKWLPAFEYFQDKWSWNRWVRSKFEGDLDDEYNRLEVVAEMMRVFPMFQVHDVTVLIDNVWHRKTRQNNTT